MKKKIDNINDETTGKKLIISDVGGQFKKRQTLTNKILNMITRSNKKAYKENNQFLLTISGLFVALTLANTLFNRQHVV